MTIPFQHLSYIQSTHCEIGRWLEIEGIPYAYGSISRPASFFDARASALDRFLGVKPHLSKVPKAINSSIDVLDGGAQTMGSFDFEITDLDSSEVAWTGVGYSTGFVTLGAEITKDVVVIPYVGDAGAFNAGDYLYIGTETIKIGTKGVGFFLDCTRGMFKSKPQAFGKGLLIGTRPYTMASRRCWYYQLAGSTGNFGTPLPNAVVTEACLRTAGLLRNLVENKETGSFILTINSMDVELDRNCFRTLRSFELKHSDIFDRKIADVDPAFWHIGDASYNTWVDGERVLIRIDDEILAATGDGTTGLILTARALMGTEQAPHKMGAIINEMIPVVASSDVVGDAGEGSKFSTTRADELVVFRDHPLLIILQILLSTGDGSNGVYDVLPADWGMGIDQTRVNIAGIEALAQEEPNIRFNGIVEEPMNFIAFMRELLSFAGYYYTVETGDIFTIRRCRPPAPDLNPRIVTHDDRIRGYQTKWEANWSGAIRELVFSYGWDILNHKYKRIIIFKSAGGELFSKGLARSLEFKTKLLYPGRSGIPGEMPMGRFSVDQWLLNRRDFFLVRYGRPPPIIHDRLNYGFLDVEVGDILVVSHPNLPSTATGAVGMVQELGEVISKQPDDNSKTIDFSILMTGWNLGSYRFLAPSAEVESVAALGGGAYNITVVENSFTLPLGPTGKVQTDLKFEGSDGSYRYGFFSKVKIWGPGFGTSQNATVVLNTSDFASNLISLSGVGAPPLPGDIITFQNYAAMVTETDLGGITDSSGIFVSGETYIKLYAFGAKANDKFEATGDPTLDALFGHRYFPI